MSLSSPSLLVVASVLAFAAFLIWKLRPVLPIDFAFGRRGARKLRGDADPLDDARDAVRRARARARQAKSPRERAEALLAAGRASSRLRDGTTAALGLYLRAVRADPTYCEPLVALAELLRDDRPELLETVLWRRLAQLPWSGDTLPATRCAVEGLMRVYRDDIPHRERARALQKLLSHI